ncbi:MAG: mobile mystery protein A [Acidobacteria bacterium]|nr:mobile mystery protein A [Acidobacteriota bacterium]
MATRNIRAWKHMDLRLERLRPLVDSPRPHKGWIRAIRDALGMSARELAARIGVSQQMVSELERSELRDTIKLATLRRTADALDCDLVYALVPRTSLDEAVKRQARKKAAMHLGPIAHHSLLENQARSETDTAAQLDDLADQFMDRRGLWSDVDQPR